MGLAQVREIGETRIEWVWTPYIPIGVSIIEGEPGLGKSRLALYIASKISKGESIPPNGDVQHGKVLYITAEDEPGVVAQRVRQFGGDEENIYLNATTTFNLFDIGEYLQEIQDVHMVIVDPLQAFVGLYSQVRFRRFATFMREVAIAHDVAIVFIRHLKKSYNDSSAIYRGIGSVDISAAARSIVVVGRMEGFGDDIIVTHVKSSYGPKGASLRFSNSPFDYAGVVDATPDDLLETSGEQRRVLDDAIAFLRVVLGDGPAFASEVHREAAELGLSRRTLYRARKLLDVRATRTWDPSEGKFRWVLSLPKMG